MITMISSLEWSDELMMSEHEVILKQQLLVSYKKSWFEWSGVGWYWWWWFRSWRRTSPEWSDPLLYSLSIPFQLDDITWHGAALSSSATPLHLRTIIIFPTIPFNFNLSLLITEPHCLPASQATYTTPGTFTHTLLLQFENLFNSYHYHLCNPTIGQLVGGIHKKDALERVQNRHAFSKRNAGKRTWRAWVDCSLLFWRVRYWWMWVNHVVLRNSVFEGQKSIRSYSVTWVCNLPMT
jgi:hypothetical protein